MTKKEFALKNFKEGAKIVVTEDKITSFCVTKMVADFTEQHLAMFTSGCWNKSPKKRRSYIYWCRIR